MIKAVFDNDIYKIGKKIGNIKIRPMKEMEDYLRIKKIKIGIITYRQSQPGSSR